MPETLSSIEIPDQDFVAPDEEAQRVTDPKKAEAMARASKDLRDSAADNRKNAKELTQDLDPDSAEMATHEADRADRGADNVEQYAADEYDRQSEITPTQEREQQRLLKELIDLDQQIEDFQKTADKYRDQAYASQKHFRPEQSSTDLQSARQANESLQASALKNVDTLKTKRAKLANEFMAAGGKYDSLNGYSVRRGLKQ